MKHTLNDFEGITERIAMIDEWDDEKSIFDTFKDDPTSSVRIAAIKKLTDEKLIFDSFKDDVEDVVRAAVVDKISDEQLIFDTFKNDPAPYVRYRVVEKLTDVDLLSTFQDDKFYDVSKAATNKVSAHYRVEVINQISDEKLLVNAFKSDISKDVRQAVANKLTDADLMSTLQDGGFLENVDPTAKKVSAQYRVEIVNQLSDEKLLVNAFKNDFSEDVRQAVVDKVTDEKLLFDGFGKDPSADIRQKVVEKLNDADLLSAFQDDKAEVVREAANTRLSEHYDEFSDALNQISIDQDLKL